MKNDLISRQGAIDAIVNRTVTVDTDAQWLSGHAKCEHEIIDIINALPSAEPERKKGKWIQNDNGTYSCSLCQSWIPKEQHYYARFCLYCGADMRGEHDE